MFSVLLLSLFLSSFSVLAILQVFVFSLFCFPSLRASADINTNGAMRQFELLDVLEFTSDRKRMSVVVRDSLNGKIILVSKGADEAILPYANTGEPIPWLSPFLFLFFSFFLGGGSLTYICP